MGGSYYPQFLEEKIYNLPGYLNFLKSKDSPVTREYNKLFITWMLYKNRIPMPFKKHSILKPFFKQQYQDFVEEQFWKMPGYQHFLASGNTPTSKKEHIAFRKWVNSKML